MIDIKVIEDITRNAKAMRTEGETIVQSKQSAQTCRCYDQGKVVQKVIDPGDYIFRSTAFDCSMLNGNPPSVIDW